MGPLADQAFEHYVEELRRGSVDPYVAFRVLERGYRLLERDAELLRRATIRMLETDPWLLATRFVHLDALKPRDLERLTPFVGAGSARAIAPMLRAKLWHDAGRRSPAQLRKALSYLQQVPAKQRDVDWHEMLVDCYRELDFTRYKRAVPKLLEATEPEWRASPLCSFLNDLAEHEDWKTYDRNRPAWDRLPADRQACECYTNHVHTDDGLRAAAAKRWADIPGCLVRAADVRGCPHLNSYGMRLDLARLLLGKRKLVAEVRVYLERAAQFGNAGEVAKLQRGKRR